MLTDSIQPWTSSAFTSSHPPPRPPTAVPNVSLPEDCMEVIFDQMDYVPWNNPDNIVSAEVEDIVRKMQYYILIVLFLFGGPANVINMAVFYQQGLKDRVNLCLFVLSLSDALYLTVYMLPFVEQIYLQFTSQEKYGPMMIFMNNYNINVLVACGFASHVLSAIIATERCLCVFYPLKFQRLLRTRTMAVIIVTAYIVVFALFFIVAFRYTIKCVYDPISGIITTTYIDGEFYAAHKQLIDYLDSVIFGAALPWSVLIVVTTTTVMTIVKLRQIASWRSEASSSLATHEVSLTKMLVANSILFILCFSPDAVNHVARMFVPEMKSGRRYHNFYLTCLWVGDIFSFFNAAMNIVVYYIMGSRYRDTLWALVSRGKKS